MRVKASDNLSCAWTVSSLPGVGLQMVAICKLVVGLASGQLSPALPAIGDLGEGELTYPSDFAPFKPRADVVLRADAHVPNGETANYLQVGFQVGALAKQLLVAGDREWRRGVLGHSAGDPVGFQRMPLSWTRALGGAKDLANPIGCGREGKRLPNVEWPGRMVKSPGDRIPPAGFGPIPAGWLPRRSCVGTYGADYVKKYWPWFPPDFDFAYFNAAPRDQQVEGYLRGDEALRFENLHRDQPVLEARLPALRTRLFVTFQDGEFREVPQRLDTLFCDLEQDRLVLIWRGHTSIGNPMLHEVAHVLAALEPLGKPCDTEHYRALRDASLAVPAKPAPDPAVAAAAAEQAKERASMTAALEKDVAEAEALAAEQLKAQEQRLMEQGLDPALLPKQPPEDLRAAVAEMRMQMDRARAADPDLLATPQDGPTDADVDEIEGMLTEMEQEERERNGGPAWTRDGVLAAHAAGRDLSGEDLSGLDLSGCDLRGVQLRGCLLVDSDLRSSDLSAANLAGVILTAAKLDAANLDGAMLDAADLTGASLVGASLRSASLHRAVLEGLALAGNDMSGSLGEAVQMAGADLTGSNCSNASFAKGDFTGCKLGATDFTGASLANARLHAAAAQGAVFQRADLQGVRADDGANFEGADFRHANADGAVLEFACLRGCDFRYSTWIGALLTGSDFEGADLSRSDLRRASLADARLVRARLLQANLLQASMDRCDLTFADMRWANLYRAGLWEAKVEHTDLREANLGATLLSLR